MKNTSPSNSTRRAWLVLLLIPTLPLMIGCPPIGYLSPWRPEVSQIEKSMERVERKIPIMEDHIRRGETLQADPYRGLIEDMQYDQSILSNGYWLETVSEQRQKEAKQINRRAKKILRQFKKLAP